MTQQQPFKMVEVSGGELWTGHEPSARIADGAVRI